VKIVITFTPCFYAIFCAKLVDYNKEWANRVRHLYLLLLAGPTAAPAAPAIILERLFYPNSLVNNLPLSRNNPPLLANYPALLPRQACLHDYFISQKDRHRVMGISRWVFRDRAQNVV
jgi:hypothetical protein